MHTSFRHRFDGYTVLEQIGETHHSVVYRATVADREETVILKVVNTQNPTAEQVARFKRENTIIQGLDIEGVVRPLNFIENGNVPVLVLEDFGGVPLKDFISGGMGLNRFFSLSIQLAEILGALHQSNVSHCDIKPSNILLNPELNIIKITDFGISELIPVNEKIIGAAVGKGTLAYISPEQTGRLNCGVDYRTDLYSLGVTFYEMLTGVVPFRDRNTMDIIHAHIAKRPLPPCECDSRVPLSLSNIVMKLMSKSAEERYQNSFGLAADLRECFDQLQQNGMIKSFPLGVQDVSIRFILPRLLVGRTKEFDVLRAALDRVCRAGAEVVFIEGEPGIGKSALANEMSQLVAAKGGYFLDGKFDPVQRANPYSAIIQAFQWLIRQLLAENDEQLQQWKDRLLSAVGTNGKILNNLFPDLELIIGEQPNCYEIGAEAEQNRFKRVFKQFISVFVGQGHPLVLFLDDLQWADSASLELLESILADQNLRHFLLVAAYRELDTDQEDSCSPPQHLASGVNIPVHKIQPGPLAPVDIAQMMISFLYLSSEDAQVLARVIHAKTKGNPFFVHQFLKTLSDKKMLRVDSAKGWVGDIEQIKDLHATDNVVELMADKLHDLSPVSLKIVQLCACIGNRFDLETLAWISEHPMEDLLSIIDGLLLDELIQRTGNAYRFCHGRVQEAAYDLMDRQDRERMHYRIGMLQLERSGVEEQHSDHLFFTCDQLNQAGQQLSGETERIVLAELNLKAGLKAKKAAAFAAAVNYLTAGCRLLPEDAWQNHYNLTCALYAEQMECQYLNRNFEEAERLFDVILGSTASKLDKAEAYITMIVLYTNMHRPKVAAALGIKALELFGIKESEDIGTLPVLKDLILVKRKLAGIGIENLKGLPFLEDKEVEICIQLLLATSTPSYYVNKNLFAKLVIKAVRLCLDRGGLTIFSPVAFVSLATVIQTALGDYKLAHRLGEQAVTIAGHPEFSYVAGIVYHTFPFFIQHWKLHARHNIAYFEKAYQLSIEAGHFIYAGHSINAATDYRIIIGRRLDDIYMENQLCSDLMDLVKDPFITARHTENNQFILNLKGETDGRFTMSGPGFDETIHIQWLREQKNVFGLCYTLLYKMKLYYLYGEFREAHQIAIELDKIINVQMGTMLVPEHHHYYSLVLTAMSIEDRSGRLISGAVIRRNQRKMRKWARLCPENFQHKYDLVAAEINAVRGRQQDALKCYHAAVNGAWKYNFTLDESLAYERLASFYHTIGLETESVMFMRRAYRGYSSWGATAKLEQMENLYPYFAGSGKRSALRDTFTSTTTSDLKPASLDLSTVMQVSQLISREIMLDRLLTKTMHISLANAGAERGYLILENDGKLEIQASEDMDTGEQQVLQGVALEKCRGLSPAIVNFVYHSGKHLILGNALKEGDFTNDPHVREQGCRSILCMPIMNKGRFVGILYMENNLTKEAFTPDRIELLRVISSQAAISLQNARLYEEISTEIDVRQKAEDALRINEEKYRTILEEMQDAYCETDLEGRITFVNPSTCRISGFTASELLGSNIRQYLVGRGQQSFGRYFYEILVTGRPGKPFSDSFRTKSGNTISVEILSSPMFDKNGRITGFRNVARDDSERKRLEKDLLESIQNVQNARTATILGLAKLAEYRDVDTGAHLERIGAYARIIALELAKLQQYKSYITEAYIEDIYNSAILHDIGKVGVPDAILLKAGKLTENEFEIIKTHSALGGDALKEVETNIHGQTFLTLGKEIAYYHHEKWDGTGYPNGLKGEQIPLSARIVALADVYDALTSKRTYKEAFPHQVAVEIIRKDRGTHFAPDVVDAFLVNEDKIRRIREAAQDKSAGESAA